MSGQKTQGTVHNDKLVNLVSGLGGIDDKSTGNLFSFVPMTPDQLVAAYRGDWLAAKIVDIPAEDATREWRTWSAQKEQISAIEATEQRIGLQPKVEEAMQKARLLGGAALLIGVRGDDWEKPIEPARVKRDGLQYVHVVDRQELSAGELDRDLLSPYFGEPKYYTLGSSTSGAQRIHPSRVVRFVPRPPPLRSLEVDGWGDSILQAVADAIHNAALASQGVATLINEASVDVVKIPGFMDQVATAEYRDKVLERFRLAKVSKSLVNMLMLDAEEDWEKHATNFANLPEVVRVYLNIAAGAGDIPATRLLGQSPTGLNATGESDVRNYYDKIGAYQRNKLGPAMSRLDEVLIRSALGDRPPEVFYNWRPLWQQSDTEKADNLLKRSQAVANIFSTGLVPDAALAAGVGNMLVEDGSLPGIEQALDEDDAADLDETDPNAAAQFDRRKVNDATPRSLYVCRKVLNADAILAWAAAQGIPDLYAADDLHVTITYSRQPVDWLKMGEAWAGPDGDGTLTIPAGGPRLVELLGESGRTVVLCFASNELAWRHARMRDEGASWDWPDYQPHISVGKADAIPEGVQPYTGEIRLGPELFEEVTDDWAKGRA